MTCEFLSGSNYFWGIYICWLDSYRVPQKYKNHMQSIKVTFEPAKPGLDILYPAYDFWTERYGKLSNQYAIFSVNGPFVPSYLGLIINYYL